MTDSLPSIVLQILQISWIDLLLSGDNAVVIALACRDLPENRRKLGIALGAVAAVALRVVFTLLVVQLMALPFVKLIGGVLLIGIAIKLVTGEESHGKVKARPSVLGAVLTIMIADGVMSLDNVLAIVGVAHGDTRLIVFGLLLSIPLVVFGAGAIMKLIDRWPVLIWLGAALLGWVAGDMLAADTLFAGWLDRIGDPPDIVASIAGATIVIAVAAAIEWRRPKAE